MPWKPHAPEGRRRNCARRGRAIFLTMPRWGTKWTARVPGAALVPRWPPANFLRRPSGTGIRAARRRFIRDGCADSTEIFRRNYSGKPWAMTRKQRSRRSQNIGRSFCSDCASCGRRSCRFSCQRNRVCWANLASQTPPSPLHPHCPSSTSLFTSGSILTRTPKPARVKFNATRAERGVYAASLANHLRHSFAPNRACGEAA